MFFGSTARWRVLLPVPVLEPEDAADFVPSYDSTADILEAMEQMKDGVEDLTFEL